MSLSRSLGIAAALCLCLVVTASAAPRKKARPARRPVSASGPVRHIAPAAPVPPAAPSAAPAPGDVVLYGGGAPASSGLSLATFGGGAVEDDTDQSFAKGHSVKITTLDAYQGATLTFAAPPALGDLSDKARFLDFTVRLGSILVSAGRPKAALSNPVCQVSTPARRRRARGRRRRSRPPSRTSTWS